MWGCGPLTKRSRSITSKLYPFALIALLLAIWSGISYFGVLPGYMLPSPWAVARAFVKDFGLLMNHARISLWESFLGLFCSTALAFVLAVLMDRFLFLHRSVYPLLVLTQTVPSIAIAPLLVLWFGYGLTPKVLLIVIVCFFPTVIGLLSGFAAVDRDVIRLFTSMGASKWQILWQVKIPSALPHFFSGFRIAASYSIVGAVVAEWLGGEGGLGVYMTRVRKSYAFDKMFAVIFLVSIISLLLLKLVGWAEKKAMPYNQKQKS